MKIWYLLNYLWRCWKKITCWYSDNSLNSFTNKGIVHKKNTHFPQPAPMGGRRNFS